MKNEIINPEDHGKLRKKYNISGDKLTLKADAIVIGSGAGGAVTAAELARQNYAVILIEEGPSLKGEEYSPDEYRTLSRIYQDAAYVSSENYSMHILAGRVMGGSTTVNWQTCIYPEGFVTDEWEREFGLKGYSKNEMSSFINEVENKIGVKKVPERMINENNRLLMEGAKKLAIPYEINKNNNGGTCIGLGRCGMGCPVDAKKSTAVTFVPEALEKRALVFSCVAAEKIEDGKIKKVKGIYSPDPGKPGVKGAIKEFEFSAPVVVVSGGALGSPVILQKSKLGNSFVGKRLKVYPTAHVIGKFKNPVENFHGTPQSVVVENFKNLDNKGHGYLLEAAPHHATIATLLVPFYGETVFNVMKDYRYLQAGIIVTRDGADNSFKASVEYSGGQRKVEYELSKADGKNLLEGIRRFALIQKAAGAEEITFPFYRLEEPVKVNDNDDFSWVLKEKTTPGDFLIGSAHPHGSVQAALSDIKGALSPDFELYGHENIYVIDGSWMPTAIGVNPQILIMSAALRAARKLGDKMRGMEGLVEGSLC